MLLNATRIHARERDLARLDVIGLQDYSIHISLLITGLKSELA